MRSGLRAVPSPPQNTQIFQITRKYLVFLGAIARILRPNSGLDFSGSDLSDWIFRAMDFSGNGSKSLVFRAVPARGGGGGAPRHVRHHVTRLREAGLKKNSPRAGARAAPPASLPELLCPERGSNAEPPAPGKSNGNPEPSFSGISKGIDFWYTRKIQTRKLRFSGFSGPATERP